MGALEKLEKRIAGAWIDEDEDNLKELAEQILEYVEGQGFAHDEQEALKEKGLYMLADICQSIGKGKEQKRIREGIGICEPDYSDDRIRVFNFGPN